MKTKIIIIITVLFFLLVNTQFFWEMQLGISAIPVFIGLVALFVALSIALAIQVVKAFRERFTYKLRLLSILLLSAVLPLAYAYPRGLIDMRRSDDDALFIAGREGAANCTTTLRIYPGHEFTERNICFGLSETNGTYRIINDTIFFEETEPGRDEDAFYQYAIIRTDKHEIVRYKDMKDSTGHILWITKNELDLAGQ